MTPFSTSSCPPIHPTPANTPRPVDADVRESERPSSRKRPERGLRRAPIAACSARSVCAHVGISPPPEATTGAGEYALPAGRAGTPYSSLSRQPLSSAAWFTAGTPAVIFIRTQRTGSLRPIKSRLTAGGAGRAEAARHGSRPARPTPRRQRSDHVPMKPPSPPFFLPSWWPCQRVVFTTYPYPTPTDRGTLGTMRHQKEPHQVRTPASGSTTSRTVLSSLRIVGAAKIRPPTPALLMPGAAGASEKTLARATETCYVFRNGTRHRTGAGRQKGEAAHAQRSLPSRTTEVDHLHQMLHGQSRLQAPLRPQGNLEV